MTQFLGYQCYFLSARFLGGIFGAVVYSILVGGLLTITTQVKLDNTIPIIVLAALAGYNWEWTVKVFNRLGELLTPEESNAES